MGNDAPSAAGKPGLVCERRLAKGHLGCAVGLGRKSRERAGRGGGGKSAGPQSPWDVLSAFSDRLTLSENFSQLSKPSHADCAGDRVR